MITILILVFAVITTLWLFYWAIVRSFILDSAQDELCRMSAALDWAIIEDQIGAKTEAAQQLSKHLEYPEAVRAISLFQAIIARFFRPVEMKTELARERIIFNNSQPWLREMWQRKTQVYVKAAMANSPACWLPLALVLLAGIFSQKIQQWWDETISATEKLKGKMKGEK